MAARLIDAVHQGHFTSVKKRIEIYQRHPKSVLARRQGSFKDLLQAALEIENEQKRYAMFRYLCECQKKDSETWTDEVASDDQLGRSALMHACALGRAREVLYLLNNHDTDIQALDAQGCSALHLAVMAESIICVRALTRRIRQLGLTVDIEDAQGFTPYQLAVRMDHTDIADILATEGRAATQRIDPMKIRRAMVSSPATRASTARIATAMTERSSLRTPLVAHQRSRTAPPLSIANLRLQAPIPDERDQASPTREPRLLDQHPIKIELHKILDIYSQQFSAAYRKTAFVPDDNKDLRRLRQLVVPPHPQKRPSIGGGSTSSAALSKRGNARRMSKSSAPTK